ncbi:MAG: hypothetical protein H6742_21800 [Alphaproteobacteria bacterium]|nr:hypothetical protein [Alphaproteobacteria bacterium]
MLPRTRRLLLAGAFLLPSPSFTDTLQDLAAIGTDACDAANLGDDHGNGGW